MSAQPALVAPSRGCGSKRAQGAAGRRRGGSPPHGGADRNASSGDRTLGERRRPLTGVRIETDAGFRGWWWWPVAPSRGCGSKQPFCRRQGRQAAVAPSRGCGSKPLQRAGRARRGWSPPHGGADRNSLGAPGRLGMTRRPLTGVRIETPRARASRGCDASPPHGGADRNAARIAVRHVRLGSPPHGGADRNNSAGDDWAACLTSPPHGGADRNLRGAPSRRSRGCRPLTGVRIETSSTSSRAGRLTVAPSRGCGSKPLADMHDAHLSNVAPSRGCGSKQLTGMVIGFATRSPPHGGADRNPLSLGAKTSKSSRPLTGVRIETGGRYRKSVSVHVAPSRGCGSKHCPCPLHCRGTWSPPHGGADRNGVQRSSAG